MDQHGQQLAETYLEMHNTHQPDLVDRYVAVDYRNHNPFVADGREANRALWTINADHDGMPTNRRAGRDARLASDARSA